MGCGVSGVWGGGWGVGCGVWVVWCVVRGFFFWCWVVGVECGVWVVGFGVSGLGFGVGGWGLGVGGWGLGLRVEGWSLGFTCIGRFSSPMSVTSLPITCCGVWNLASGFGFSCPVFVLVFLISVLGFGVSRFIRRVLCMGVRFRVQATDGVEGHARVWATSDMMVDDVVARPLHLQAHWTGWQ